MKPLTCCMFVFVLLAASAFAYVDAKSDAAARAKEIAPFVEAETIAVVHVDLIRLDPASIIDIAARFAPLPPGELIKIKEVSANNLKKAIQLGVKDLYLVATSGELGWIPTVYGVIPMPTNVDEKAFRERLQIPAAYGRFVQGAYVYQLIPERPVEKQPREFRPASRPELTAAFEEAGDSAVQVALIPPAYTTRVIEELLPQFPKEIGGGPTTVLTKGLLWAAVGINFPPHPAIQLSIKSTDTQAAEAFRVKLADMMRLAGERPVVRKVVPKYDDVAAVLAPKVEGDRLVLVLNQQNQGVEKLLSLVTPPIELIQSRNARLQSTINLKNLALAMHNYCQANKSFPLPNSYSKDGKPLLSWRVHILPFLDENVLYKQFHLDEPWDSPHNRTLIDKMPSLYRLPLSKSEKGRTNYLLPVGNGAVFETDKPTKLQDIKDGTSNTIMVVEVDDEHAVIWTKPEDLQFDPNDPTRGLGRFFDGSFNAAICDGSVRYFAWPTDPKVIEILRYSFERADRHPITW